MALCPLVELKVCKCGTLGKESLGLLTHPVFCDVPVWESGKREEIDGKEKKNKIKGRKRDS